LPWALFARLEQRGGDWRSKLERLFANRMARDIFRIVMPLMAALFVLGHVEQEDIGRVARAAMLLPVAWLTLKYGWRASVLGCTFIATCICAMYTCKVDGEMVQVQAYVVIAVNCLYVFGAYISAQSQQKEQVRTRMLQAQQAAKNSLNVGDRSLARASKALESVLGVLEVEQMSVSEKLRVVATEAERRVYDKQASLIQQRIYRLAESIHPSAWREGGMQAALRDSVGAVLREAGLAYHFREKGRCSEALSPSAQGAIYRTICAAVASMSTDLACDAVDVEVREGRTHGHRWIMLRIDGMLNEKAVARNICLASERERVAPKLGAYTLDFQELRSLIRLFDGELRIQEKADKVRVTALLFDGVQRERESAVTFAPARLWVG